MTTVAKIRLRINTNKISEADKLLNFIDSSPVKKVAGFKYLRLNVTLNSQAKGKVVAWMTARRNAKLF